MAAIDRKDTAGTMINHAQKAFTVLSVAMALKGIVGGSILAISGSNVLVEHVLHGELTFGWQAALGVLGGVIGFLVSLRA